LDGVIIAPLALMASVSRSLGRGAVVDQTFQTQIIKIFIRNACFYVGAVSTCVGAVILKNRQSDFCLHLPKMLFLQSGHPLRYVNQYVRHICCARQEEDA
jgi:hypothetical protein